MGLEEQVAELSERVNALELEKARYRAERDALSQRVDTLQSSSLRAPASNPVVCVSSTLRFACILDGSSGPTRDAILLPSCTNPHPHPSPLTLIHTLTPTPPQTPNLIS